mmetsp:Transcript_36966/g.102715  ORF Transcript_36966/g.102715 Transcript_36966/m.102715 type:complete len:417 (-) Transcript_36966:73-1323(-)
MSHLDEALASDGMSSPGPICLAFSGAGLHGFYFNGVCQYIHEQEIEVKEAWGSSAGALAALSVLMKVGPQAYETVFANYDTNYHHVPWMLWHGRDFVWEGPDGGIRRFMPRGPEAEAAWLKTVVNGRLHIVVTKLVGWRFERVVVNYWTSVEDLIGCVRATMTIPGITAARPYSWRDAHWLDGGFMDQHPSTDKAVLVSTSLPVQPWAASWHRHVDIFRHLPLRMSWWHSNVSCRRDMFKLGYMDAKTYFETEFEEQRAAKPLRPRARAMRFLMNLALELIQGTFMLALTARFVWRRKGLWRCLVQGFWASAPGLQGSLRTPASSAWVSRAALGRCLQRFGFCAELASIAAASLALWFTTVDMRLDLSDHLLDLAAKGLGNKRFLRSSSSSAALALVHKAERTRRARSQPCRARRA